MREKNEEGKIVFVSYAREDDDLREELDKHFSGLKRQKIIKVWYKQDISAGVEWKSEIDSRLNSAHIILLLVSPDFMASEYCYSKEMKQAMERYERGEAQVIPIIIRPVDWEGSPFSKLQVLPNDAKPITEWNNRDKAFLNIVEGIRKMIGAESPSQCLQALDASGRSRPFWLSFVQWFTAHTQDRLYYQHLGYEYRMFDVQGLDTRIAHDLELEQVFIDLCINSMPAHQALADPLHPPESLQGAHSIWYYLSNPILAKHHLIVLGAPGSGKTTLLKHLALTLAQPKKRTRQRRMRHIFPILLFLRDHARAIVTQPDFLLAQAVQNHIQQKWQTLWPITWISHHLKREHCLILLDGLDEIGDSETRRLVVAWIQKQFLVNKGNRFVLTSRPYGYRDNQLHGIIVLDIQAFTSDQIEQFVKKWYLANEILDSKKDDPDIPMRASQKAENLQQDLRRSPTLLTLAVNPLLLTMILTVHNNARGLLPRRRVELYAEMCQVLLGKRQEARGIAQDLSQVQKQQVLRPLAYFLMQQEKREIEGVEAEAIIAPALALIDAQIQPTDFLPLTENTSGLLLDRGSGIYGFVHQTFQEYLTATHIKEEGLERVLIAQLTNSWWHETIRLYCAQANATAVIQACLEESPLTAKGLVLAFECNEEKLKLEPKVQAQLDSMLEAREEDPDPERRNIIAEAALMWHLNLLNQRLHRMIYLRQDTYIDTSLITCAEYQVFLDEKHAEGHHRQPDHWATFSFLKGSGKTPVLGVRRSDAQEFCKWLTIRDREGWCYRLPRAEEWPLEERQKQKELHVETGYWVEDKPCFVWSHGKPSDVLHQQLSHCISRARDYALAHERVYKLSSVLNRTFDHVLDHSFDDQRPFNHSLDRAIDRCLNRALAIDRALSATLDDRAIEIAQADYFNPPPSFAGALDGAISLSIDSLINTRPNINFTRFPFLQRVFSTIGMDHDYYLDRTRIFNYALDLDFDRAHDLDSILNLNLDSSIASLSRARVYALDLYMTLFLLQERITGNLPLYEGILVVKIRKQEKRDA